MSCSHFEERLALYASCDLDPLEATQVELHLQDCSPCRVFLQEIRQSLALLDEEPVDSAAIDAVRERTLAALRPAPLHLWRYAAAVSLLSGGLSWGGWPTELPGPPAVSVAVAPPNLPPAPAPAPVLVRTKKVRKVVGEHESVVVKLETSDPNVVIYWITD